MPGITNPASATRPIEPNNLSIELSRGSFALRNRLNDVKKEIEDLEGDLCVASSAVPKEERTRLRNYLYAARDEERAVLLSLALMDERAGEIGMPPPLPNMLFHLRTVELPDTTQTEAELRRDELKSMLEEWTDAPDARHFDFATDHLVYGKKHRSVVIPDGKDWVVIACHICGANCTTTSQKFFNGAKGLRDHLIKTHKLNGDECDAEFMRKYNIPRRLTQAEVELLVNGGKIVPAIKKCYRQKATAS